MPTQRKTKKEWNTIFSYAVIKSKLYINIMSAAFSRVDNLGQYKLDIFRKWLYRKKESCSRV